MFESEFWSERRQKSVKVREVSYTVMVHILDFLSETSSVTIDEDNVFDLLQASGMLQIVKLQLSCIQYLVQNLSLENVLTTLSYSERLLLEELYNKALQFILCETEGDINAIENMIDAWVESDRDRHEPQKEKLRKCIVDSKVEITSQPCCVGRFKKTPYLFMFDTDKAILEPYLSLSGKATSKEGVTACGFKMFSCKSKLYLFGGEFGQYGRGQWNYSVWRYDSIAEDWSQILELENPIRHCSIACDGKRFFVIGGFGKYRIMNSMVEVFVDDGNAEIKLETFATMKEALYSAPAFYHDNSLYILKSTKSFWRYDEQSKKWDVPFQHVKFPNDIELAFANVYEDNVYVSPRNSRKLFSFPLKSAADKIVEIFEIGEFEQETQNLTLVNGTLFNFSSDQFDYMSVIEAYSIANGKFSVLFKSEDPELDFSPYFSFGCMPLLVMPKFKLPHFVFKNS